MEFVFFIFSVTKDFITCYNYGNRITKYSGNCSQSYFNCFIKCEIVSGFLVLIMLFGQISKEYIYYMK